MHKPPIKQTPLVQKPTAYNIQLQTVSSGGAPKNKQASASCAKLTPTNAKI